VCTSGGASTTLKCNNNCPVSTPEGQNENSDLYVDKMDRKIKETPLEFGLGLGDGFEDTFEESEWRYESGNYGGHL